MVQVVQLVHHDLQDKVGDVPLALPVWTWLRALHKGRQMAPSAEAIPLTIREGKIHHKEGIC